MDSKDQLIMLRRSDFTTAKVTAAPIVSMTVNDGKIQFNYAATQLLKIKDGDYVELGYAKDNERRLWFRKGTPADGYLVHARKPKRDKSACVIMSLPLVRHIRKILDTDYNISVQLGTEPENGVYWAMEASYQFTKPRKWKAE